MAGMDEDCRKIEEDRIVGKLIEKISAPPLPVRVAVMRTAICAYSHGQILHQVRRAILQCTMANSHILTCSLKSRTNHLG